MLLSFKFEPGKAKTDSQYAACSPRACGTANTEEPAHPQQVRRNKPVQHLLGEPVDVRV